MAELRQINQRPAPSRSRLSRSAVRIEVENLRLRTYIGFNPEELSKLQDVIINCSLSYQGDSACSTDDEDQALNYKVITKKIIALVENGQFRLLEKLASEILDILTENPSVIYADVKVDKPHALRFADSVAVSLSAHREHC